jgi:hypothetical protein
VWSTVACGVALTGCGGSQTKTFSRPGFAIHFSYPAELSPLSVQYGRVVGRSAGTTDVALGIEPHDLIVVTRYPAGSVLTSANISSFKALYDRLLSRAFGQAVVSTVKTVGGLPALSYPPVTSQAPFAHTSRVTFVFAARREYELNCQYTSKGRATIVKACNQMLATLHT